MQADVEHQKVFRVLDGDVSKETLVFKGSLLVWGVYLEAFRFGPVRALGLRLSYGDRRVLQYYKVRFLEELFVHVRCLKHRDMSQNLNHKP